MRVFERPILTALTIGGNPRFATLWRVYDQAGSLLVALTDFGHPLTRGGILHQPYAAARGSAAAGAAELEPADAEMRVAFDVGNLSLSELRGRLAHGGRVQRDVIDYLLPDLASYSSDTFEVGGTNYDGEEMTLSLTDSAEALAQLVGFNYERNCRWDFGIDSTRGGCPYNLAAATATSTVSSVPSPRSQFVASFTPPAAGFEGYAFGAVEFTDGDNAGFRTEIRAYAVAGTSHTFTLQEPAPNPIQVGDGIKVEPGCPGTTEACEFYDQLLNFGGFPDVPGEDLLLSVPEVPDA